MIISVIIFAVPLSSMQVFGYTFLLSGLTIYNTLRVDKADAEKEVRPGLGLSGILSASTRSPLLYVLAPAVVGVYLVGVIGVRICISPPQGAVEV